MLRLVVVEFVRFVESLSTTRKHAFSLKDWMSFAVHEELGVGVEASFAVHLNAGVRLSATMDLKMVIEVTDADKVTPTILTNDLRGLQFQEALGLLDLAVILHMGEKIAKELEPFSAVWNRTDISLSPVDPDPGDLGLRAHGVSVVQLDRLSVAGFSFGFPCLVFSAFVSQSCNIRGFRIRQFLSGFHRS